MERDENRATKIREGRKERLMKKDERERQMETLREADADPARL